MNMTFSASCVAMTMQFEGLDLSAYPDPATNAEPYTCGYGHTGPDVKMGMVVSMDQARAWLNADLGKAAATVNTHVTVPLTQNQFDALCDFVFNEGAGNFIASTLLRLLNAGRYADAATQFQRWDLANGKVMNGLARRRLAEKNLFMRPDQARN